MGGNTVHICPLQWAGQPEVEEQQVRPLEAAQGQPGWQSEEGWGARAVNHSRVGWGWKAPRGPGQAVSQQEPGQALGIARAGPAGGAHAAVAVAAGRGCRWSSALGGGRVAGATRVTVQSRPSS